MKILISEQQIKEKISDLAKNIAIDYKNKDILLLSVLNGSFIFTSDLIRELYKFGLNPVVDFVKIKSYQGTTSTGNITFLTKLPEISGKNILILEDIFDTGLTLKILYHKLLSFNPLSLNIAVLIEKNIKRDFTLPLKYVGFKIENKFVIGYGLDYNEKFRGMPFIGIYEES